MQNYNKNLAVWAKGALSKNLQDLHAWTELHEKLSKEELEELMAILAGFMSGTKSGKEVLQSLLL
jgi:di/tripeptidase